MPELVLLCKPTKVLLVVWSGDPPGHITIIVEDGDDP